MKQKLTIQNVITEAKAFCIAQSKSTNKELYGVTDGKAVGTHIEHKFQLHLADKYELKIGSSAKGIDLPTIDIDIKVTSIKQPQSSCPFKDAKQKIFGLGYNLLVFVYDKLTIQKQKQLSLILLVVHLFQKKELLTIQPVTDFVKWSRIMRMLKTLYPIYTIKIFLPMK